MPLAASLRRLAAPAAGLIGAVAICVACSSTTSGSPETVAGSAAITPPASSSLSIGPLPTSPTLSLPSLGDLPSIGGSASGTAFCKDFANIDPSSVTGNPAEALRIYDRLAADAPAEIKPDVEKIRDFIHDAISGNPPSGTEDFQQAVTHLTEYYASHCLTS
jgi:hypothetical protein